MAMAKEEQLILEWVKCRYGNGDMSSLHSLMAECEEQRILQLIDSLRLSGVLFEVFQQPEIRPLIPKTWRDHVEEDMKRIALENQMLEMQGGLKAIRTSIGFIKTIRLEAHRIWIS